MRCSDPAPGAGSRYPARSPDLDVVVVGKEVRMIARREGNGRFVRVPNPLLEKPIIHAPLIVRLHLVPVSARQPSAAIPTGRRRRSAALPPVPVQHGAWVGLINAEHSVKLALIAFHVPSVP